MLRFLRPYITALVVVCVVLLVAAILSPPSWAGDTPQATACGTYATGMSPRTNKPISGAFPNQFVNEAGYWEMPCRKADVVVVKPDCRAQQPSLWFHAQRGFTGGWCSPSNGQFLPDASIGEKKIVEDNDGPVRGSRTFVCQVRADGSVGWAAVAATCARVKGPQ